jgi:L-fuculose-phosphate aldolase
MSKNDLKKKLSKLSLSMFRKDFLGLYHGSISAKTESNRFLINTKEALFDTMDEDSFVELHFTKDYRYNKATKDADIHLAIYSQFLDAKFVLFSTAPFTTAYSLQHNIIIPKDYLAHEEFKSIDIFDPKEFEDWFERAPSEITHYFHTKETDMIVIKGYGVYCFNRDVDEMLRKLSILEHSCKLLHLNETNSRL